MHFSQSCMGTWLLRDGGDSQKVVQLVLTVFQDTAGARVGFWLMSEPQSSWWKVVRGHSSSSPHNYLNEPGSPVLLHNCWTQTAIWVFSFPSVLVHKQSDSSALLCLILIQNMAHHLYMLTFYTTHLLVTWVNSAFVLSVINWLVIK